MERTAGNECDGGQGSWRAECEGSVVREVGGQFTLGRDEGCF